MRLLWVITVMSLAAVCHGGLFSWLFKKKKTSTEEQPVPASSNEHVGDSLGTSEVALAVKIPFEIKSSDEKFLQEAAAYTSLKLSELDLCHHKVIMALQKSCSELTEEDLSKVAVNLLNCQSAAENRAIFPCTSDMSLSDCTKDMDSNTWNAYHIISNRARAVCYASRQEQFGAKTQMAVNVLMHTAEEQIRSMNDLQDSQEALGKATSETIESLSQGHDHLKQQQQQLSTAHQHVHSYISLNMRELSREKKLIASGQRELALITESIKRKLDEAKRQLLSQESGQRQVHEIILHDLSKIQDNALQVWQKLDASTQKILLAHEETVKQYRHLTDDMQRMNATVHHLMDLLHSTKQGVEDQLLWITSLVGGTDNMIQKVYSCVLHACYFFIGMVSASFLQVPYLTRVALVVLVPLNALSEVKHDISLQFSTLTSVLALCILVNLLSSFMWSMYQYRKKQKCVANGAVLQPIICSPVDTTCLNPVTQLYPNKSEKAKELDHQTVTRSSSSSSSNSNMSCDDFSCDEEPSVEPLSTSTLKRRMFGSVSSKCNASTSNTPEESNTREHLNHEGITTEKANHSGSAVKTLSSVRRQLLDTLNHSEHKLFQPDLSLDSRDTSLSSPAKDILDRSNISSRSLTPRKRCSSLCRNGQLCRNAVTGENLFCYTHGGSSREGTPVSRRGSCRSTPMQH